MRCEMWEKKLIIMENFKTIPLKKNKNGNLNNPAIPISQIWNTIRNIKQVKIS